MTVLYGTYGICACEMTELSSKKIELQIVQTFLRLQFPVYKHNGDLKSSTASRILTDNFKHR